MKKLLILLLFIFLVFSKSFNNVLYFDKKGDKEASNILYQYELKNLNITSEKAYELFNFKEENVRAVFYDLNSDGVNEVIGYINADIYNEEEGNLLFILKKNKNLNNKYLNISGITFIPEMGLHILSLAKNKPAKLGVYIKPDKEYCVFDFMIDNIP